MMRFASSVATLLLCACSGPPRPSTDEPKQSECVHLTGDRDASCFAQWGCDGAHRLLNCPAAGGECECSQDGGTVGRFGVDAGACGDVDALMARADDECAFSP